MSSFLVSQNDNSLSESFGTIAGTAGKLTWGVNTRKIKKGVKVPFEQGKLGALCNDQIVGNTA